MEDMDSAGRLTAPATSSSTSVNPKKFKLDPMSLLLPHERSENGPSRHPSRTQLGAPTYLTMMQRYQQQQVAAAGVGTRQVPAVNMRRQDETKGEPSVNKDDVLILSAAAAQSSSSVPLSPSSLTSSPQSLSWDEASSEWRSIDGIAKSGAQWGQPSRYYSYPLPHSKARLEDWEIVETLGTGTFGRVLLVRQRPSYRPTPYHPIFPHLFQSSDPRFPLPSYTLHSDSQLPHFAMKVLRKSEVVRLKQVEHISSERIILERIRHPFVVELHATYQDQLNVYMLLSYIPGGELFSHLRRAGRFSPDVTRFYLASIVLAIEYLHSQNIIYRDLKPENLLLDRHGYLRIADFGFAKVVEDRTFTLCGTPEYLAPEIVLSQGHGKAVDWWALGILAFEMLAGYPPFFDDHPLGIYEKILRGEIAFPSHIDPYAKDLVRELLTADRSKRLGNLRGGARDVMGHPWFAGVDWGSLERKEIGAPIIPRLISMGDSQNFQKYPPPRPHELPGVFGQPYDVSADPYGDLFQEFSFPGNGSEK
nr:AGC/PKA protein kinase [Cryptococcus depauperatus CBS 7855]